MKKNKKKILIDLLALMRKHNLTKFNFEYCHDNENLKFSYEDNVFYSNSIALLNYKYQDFFELKQQDLKDLIENEESE